MADSSSSEEDSLQTTPSIAHYLSQPLQVVGEGTFGRVYKAVHPQGYTVAIKKIKFKRSEYGFPLNLFRELVILQKLSHECLLQLVGVFADNNMAQEYSEGNMAAFYMVFPFMDHDLAGLIDSCREAGKPFSERQTKYYLKKIVEGVLHLHQNKIIHRDLSKFYP
jgi:serine/threonine-protein kinase BUR1